MNSTLYFPGWKIALVFVVCFAALYYALPNLFSKEQLASVHEVLPDERLNLGLDLLGGSHLLLEVDAQGYFNEQYEHLRSAIRSELRDEKIGYTRLETDGEQVTIVVRPETIGEDVSLQTVIRRAADGLEIIKDGEQRYVVTYSDLALQEKRQQLVRQTIEIISRRIDETGTREPIVQQQGDDRILLQVPGLEDPQQLKDILGTTAKMTFHLVNHQVTEQQLFTGDAPLGTMIVYSQSRADDPSRPYALFVEAALSGDRLTDANVGVEAGQPVVSFRFDTEGGRIFGDITQKNIGKQFAIVLDGKVITAPVIRSAILGGSGIIEGGFTQESASNLALLLRAGALPADVTILEERTVGPSLGADSIAAGKLAAMIAIALVAVFMLITYGLFGLFSNIALAMNLALLFGALSLLQATLTLPGIAGIVLTLGMAVDANVLIFERIREEAARGRSLRAAIDKGFSGAFATILDSNITTLIAAFVLFYFGSGTVKGFAVTLSFGILSSMFSAILLTRLMIVTWLNAGKRQALPI